MTELQLSILLKMHLKIQKFGQLTDTSFKIIISLQVSKSLNESPTAKTNEQETKTVEVLCQNKSLILGISPIPKTTMCLNSNRVRDTQEAVELTSSPYKTKLEKRLITNIQYTL